MKPDKFMMDYWTDELTSSSPEQQDEDMRMFITDKIKWNKKQIGLSKDDLVRLISFQYATQKAGLEDRFRELEKQIIKELA